MSSDAIQEAPAVSKSTVVNSFSYLQEAHKQGESTGAAAAPSMQNLESAA